jgi:hypothetical protein
MGAIGNADRDVSDHLKAFIEGGADMVVGLIGDGTSMEVVANWNSPFEGDSLGSLFAKPAGVIQAGTGMTSLTALASHQVWEGNQPYLFNLVLKFYALADAYAEVEAPIVALEKMMAPDISRITPGGRIPEPVTVNIGRRTIFLDCVLKSMSVPLDKERDQAGNLIRCEVNLQIETIEMVTRNAFG